MGECQADLTETRGKPTSLETSDWKPSYEEAAVDAPLDAAKKYKLEEGTPGYSRASKQYKESSSSKKEDTPGIKHWFRRSLLEPAAEEPQPDLKLNDLTAPAQTKGKKRPASVPAKINSKGMKSVEDSIQWGRMQSFHLMNEPTPPDWTPLFAEAASLRLGIADAVKSTLKDRSAAGGGYIQLQMPEGKDDPAGTFVYTLQHLHCCQIMLDDLVEIAKKERALFGHIKGYHDLAAVKQMTLHEMKMQLADAVKRIQKSPFYPDPHGIFETPILVDPKAPNVD